MSKLRGRTISLQPLQSSNHLPCDAKHICVFTSSSRTRDDILAPRRPASGLNSSELTSFSNDYIVRNNTSCTKPGGIMVLKDLPARAEESQEGASEEGPADHSVSLT